MALGFVLSARLRARLSRAACVAGLAVAWCAVLAGQKADFKIIPPEISLSSAADEHGVLIQGGDGKDLTRAVRFASSDPNIFRVTTNGTCRPVGDGSAELLAIHNGRTNRAKVTVRDAARCSTPSFRQEIEPALTRLGCNMGACHGKLAGQNGFRLSLRGYAPELDHRWLTMDVLGRRIDPAFPEESLLVRKPLGRVPHEGRVRFDEGSRYHRMLVDWISARAPGPAPAEKELNADTIEVLPGDRVLQPGESQQLLVRAHWKDGTTKDVTWLTQFFSNNEPIASVTADGFVKVRRSGETTIRAHFQGQVAVIRFTASFTNKVDKFDFARTQTGVDAPVFAKLKALRIPPSPACDDATFLRRAMLDTIGTLPSAEEVERFATDRRRDKRQRLVEALFQRPEFVDYWTLQLADLFQNRKERDHDVRGNKNVRAFHAWLRGQVAANRPWNELVREVLMAKGDSVHSPEIGYYIYLVGEKQATESEVTDAVAQTFLGARIGCARCHNHPLEKYTQDDFYHFAAFFDRVSLDRKGPTELKVQSREEVEKSKHLADAEKKLQETQAKLLGAEGKEKEAAQKGFAEAQHQVARIKRELAEAHARAPRARQPRTHQEMIAQALDREPVDWTGVDDPRAKLADWITSTNNQAFGGAMINRLWKHFMRVGMVEPVDDIRASNPPMNPQLWNYLCAEFVKSGYDRKHIMRLILNSRAYQLGSETIPGNESDPQYYSHYYARRLPSEVIADALSTATGVPDAFDGFPVGLRAIQLPEPTVNSYFLTLFGRSERVTACACERNGEVTLPQLLHLQNGEDIFKKIDAKEGRLAAIQAQPGDIRSKIEALYLTTLSRKPRPDEVASCLGILGPQHPESGLSDLFWALLNAKEFAFNH